MIKQDPVSPRREGNGKMHTAGTMGDYFLGVMISPNIPGEPGKAPMTMVCLPSTKPQPDFYHNDAYYQLSI